MKLEVAKWRVAEAAAREKLLSITQLNQTAAMNNAATHAQNNLAQSSPRTLSPPPVSDTVQSKTNPRFQSLIVSTKSKTCRGQYDG